jgi:precorrin-2 dehydrogenase / sirohydrochlorin ferrochelatase
MSRMPLNIEMKGKRVLIAGGGSVACRKLKILLEAGAGVCVVAPVMAPEIEDLSSTGDITTRIGEYDAGDLNGVFLVVAATDDGGVNRQIAADAKQRGILAVVADAPDMGDCTFPALLRRGDLEISVGSGGRCPAFAALVRDVVADVIGEEYGVALERIAVEREKLLTAMNGSTYNKKLIYSLAEQMISGLTKHKESL